MPLIRKPSGPHAPDAGPDFEQARASLTADQVDDRWRAARALAAFPQAAAVLAAAIGSEPEPRVREAMFTSLARIGSADSLQALAQHIRSDNAAVRTGAMDALKATPDGLPAVMEGLLGDPDPDVRLLACDLVRELPAAQASSLLSAVLDADGEVNVCAAAVDVLADIGTADALPSLHRCAERFSGEPFLAFAIKVASDRIGTQATARG